MIVASSVSFVDDICEYISEKTDFYYGADASLPSGKTRWLKAGRLPRGLNGVYAMGSSTRPPDPEDGIMYFSLQFWALNKSTEQADRDLQVLNDLFYGNHDFPTDNFYVFQSFLTGQSEDWDETVEGLKVLSLSAIFYVRYLIS